MRDPFNSSNLLLIKKIAQKIALNRAKRVVEIL